MDNPATAAADRVERFMTEYAAQWQIAAPAFDRGNRAEEPVDRFALWRELMAETVGNHFTATTHVDLAGSFGSPAEYGPEQATIVRADVADDVAHVLARRTMRIERYHEYTLQLVDGDWRIVAIDDHSSDPSDPFVPRAEVDQRVQECSSDAPLAPMPDEQAHLDEVHNFTTRQVTNHDGDPEPTLVQPIGTLVTTSGVLSVLDFGYDNDDARPLARTVPPGSYPVDRLTWDGRNAAVRVRLSDHAPTVWHPASTVGSGHVFGVDAGCACVVDHVAYATMTGRAKAAALRDYETATRPAAKVFTAGDCVGLAFDSGYGDGGYPAYWGVDADGNVAQLVIDFMVLVDQDGDGVLTHR